ncbi:unnamed protein product [Larinioides sclopetarius]|uniref:RING-type domain-containing protein n=1 Tax=Larinioides sclopetarius TaxID=280406 RepID=A0AAV1Z7C1_9ARAC
MLEIYAKHALLTVKFAYKFQDMASFQDDSTDDEIGVNLQLAERLSINKGDHVSSHRSLPNGKALKQLHNYQRKNHLHDYKSSSSSSSLDTHSDPLVLEGSSSFGHHNKKRQNGDKNIEHLNNSKRTCLGDRLLRSPEWKMNGNDIPDAMHYSSQPTNPSVKNLYPDKTYEDHLNNMSDDDSDFQPRKRLPSKSIPQGAGKSSRTFRGFGLPKTSKKLFENQPSGSNGVHFIDSTSDDDSRTVMRNGALKGGRQSPEFSDKKRWGRKIAKVLDSDSDELQADYRTRPVIFSSSSDSEDCRPGEKINIKSNSVSKKSANPSFPSGNSESDNRYYMEHDEPMHSRFNGASSSRQFNSSIPSSSSDYRTKNPRGKPSKVHNKPSNSSYQNFYPVTNDVEASFHARGNSSSRKSHSRSPSTSQPRSLRSHRHTGIRKSPKGIGGPRQNQVHPAEQALSDMFSGDGNSARRSPNFCSDHFSPVNLSMTSYHPRDGNHSIRSISRPITGRHHRANNRKTLKGRCLNGACSQESKNNLASIYPDIFDAEDSSEVEFFTANSYSDNESNTESLNNLRVNPNPKSQPAQRQETLSDNPVSVVSSEDEISVIFSSAPRQRTSDSRRTSRTLGRRYRRGPQGFRASGQDVVSLSPDPVEQVRQVEEDERFARMLQAQFDAEADPSYVPCNRIPSPNLPRNVSSRHYISSDDDSSLDLQMESESLNRLTYDTLTSNSPLRGLHVRLSRYPMSPTFYSSGGGRPTTRNRRRFSDIETHFMNWNTPNPLSLFNFDTSDDSYEAFLGLAELNGEVSRGLQRTEINRLPTRKYVIPNGASSSKSAEVPHKRAELNKECQVCLNDYVNGDVLRILPCFHEFHTPCIDPWLKINHTCPVCRVIVNLEE